MKLKRTEIFALIEAGLFIVGATILSIVIASPEDPEWALWVGLVFALAGAVMWSLPYFGVFGSKVNKKNAEIKQKIDAAEARAEQKIEDKAVSALHGSASAPTSGAEPLSPPASPVQVKPQVQPQAKPQKDVQF